MSEVENYKPSSDYDAQAPLKVDLTKFQVGDYVTVRTKIVAFEGPTANALPITIDPNPWANEIVGHEPAGA
jgi:hypothetical protein